MEKENFLGKLRKLVELAKSKQNALDVTEINNFFMGDNLQTRADGADLQLSGAE